jgi:hypothetical protein
MKFCREKGCLALDAFQPVSYLVFPVAVVTWGWLLRFVGFLPLLAGIPEDKTRKLGDDTI